MARTCNQNKRRADEDKDEAGGLNWDLVAMLDQDPKGKPHFPVPYDDNTADDDDLPETFVTDTLNDADCQRYTAWCLKRIQTMRVSNSVASMLDDPALTVKWSLPLQTYYKDRAQRLRGLELNATPSTNHEGLF
ncbi:hypothetical protein F5Y00DRAFT_226160 [Daldinia vernicosa]|uniref:uncharacterized protein n=1 Tax=Daldinia vernicosa TaxID=114800 RepID=UPI00200829A2|nr:uncharacterized protein F5Y00DRAFT_226160 [Daldinia vernicosa]KAI0852820.1 hypothetical protein F5Y00DRAFT_226160 [Daldinia vernicosa]